MSIAEAKHLVHTVEIGVRAFLAGFSLCDPVTVLNLRYLLRVSEIPGIRSAPALYAIRQSCNGFLERRLFL